MTIPFWILFGLVACTVLCLALAYRERAKYLDEDRLIGGEELDRLGELLDMPRMYAENDARYRLRLRRVVGAFMNRSDK